MKAQYFIAMAAAAIGLSTAANGWQPDVLGPGYEMRYVDQGTDYSGNVRSTIVRRIPGCSPRRGVLYVHGFNDYFFQDEMASRFVDSCYAFYAVDLRKYGRSLEAGQTAFEVRDMHEYFADIDSAVVCMKADGIEDIVLMGHSTGGLTTSLYMSEQPDTAIKALILNSPFLDWNQSKLQEKLLIPAVDLFGKLMPKKTISQGSSDEYARSLLKEYNGEWEYNTDWKLTHSPDVQLSWIKAIDEAQAEIQRNPRIMVPVLLMHSDKSLGHATEANSSNSDAVLDVADISRWGRRLGPDVTELKVKDGLHDLMLSRKQVREPLYDAVFSWLTSHAPAQ